jgi:putative ABC transport system substrate-binding protein
MSAAGCKAEVVPYEVQFKANDYERQHPMSKTVAIFVTIFAILFSADFASAQQPEKVYRIGYLTPGSNKAYRPRLAAFRKGLAALGYVEGRNFVLKERYAAGKRERLPGMAAELVRLGVHIIVTNGTTSTRLADRAARTAGKKIAVVFALATDPVGNGLVASLARPGGNITGFATSNSALVSKRLALLKEVVPAATKIAVIWSPRAKSVPPQLATLKAVAPGLGVELVPIAFDEPEQFESAFAALRAVRPDALNVLGWSLINSFRKRIATRALSMRLPTMMTNRRSVVAGALLSYSANTEDLYRRAATYVDKILKGAKPADLPVQQPTRFYLNVNLRTAKALGITVPRSILLRADRVIE